MASSPLIQIFFPDLFEYISQNFSQNLWISFSDHNFGVDGVIGNEVNYLL